MQSKINNGTLSENVHFMRLGTTENIEHMIFFCPHHEPNRSDVLDQIANLGFRITGENIMAVQLGAYLEGRPTQDMIPACLCTGKHICKMYRIIIKSREGKI